MLADFCSLFLEHGPHSGQRQLLENVLHPFWWIGHRSLDPPFEQGEKGPGQVLGDHWQRDWRRPVLATWHIRSKKIPQMTLSLQAYIGQRTLLLLTVLLTALFWNGYSK